MTREDRASSLSKSITIRPARLEDAAGLARVQTLSWRAGYAGLLPEDFLAQYEVTEQLWRQRMGDGDRQITLLVAQRGDQITGYAVAGAPPSSEALPSSVGLLYAIYVLPEAWGAGVGYELYRAVVEAMATAGFESAVLWVLPTNQRAIDFYVRQGWSADGEARQETIDGLVLDVVRYSLARVAAEG